MIKSHPEIREGTLVLLELDGQVVAGVVACDDIHNPIRLVRFGDDVTGVLADELEPIDRETFEMVIYIEWTRRDGSGDMAAASAAANIER